MSRAPREVVVRWIENDEQSISLTVTQNGIVSNHVEGLEDVVGTLEALVQGAKNDLARKKVKEKLTQQVLVCKHCLFETTFADVAEAHIKERHPHLV